MSSVVTSCSHSWVIVGQNACSVDKIKHTFFIDWMHHSYLLSHFTIFHFTSTFLSSDNIAGCILASFWFKNIGRVETPMKVAFTKVCASLHILHILFITAHFTFRFLSFSSHDTLVYWHVWGLLVLLCIHLTFSVDFCLKPDHLCALLLSAPEQPQSTPPEVNVCWCHAG